MNLDDVHCGPKSLLRAQTAISGHRVSRVFRTKSQQFAHLYRLAGVDDIAGAVFFCLQTTHLTLHIAAEMASCVELVVDLIDYPEQIE